MHAVERYYRAVNYLAAAQVYLRSNALLRKPLTAEDIKPRLLGHWGTCPGINLIHLHLNLLIKRTSAEVLLLTGPGHGAAANLANMYLDGSIAVYYPQYAHGESGLERFVRAFSWPGGFPSHLTPLLPGTIHEGGELGYALSTAFGAVLDNPNLIAACIVGDGEAETGPTATAWHGTKYLNPATDGAVLPIVHLNGFKISSPTVYGSMSDEELRSLFEGYGYSVEIVTIGIDMPEAHAHKLMAAATDQAYERIRAIQTGARSGGAAESARRNWPVIILRSPKGWTGPRFVDHLQVEGTSRSHQVPAKEARTNAEHLRVLESWLRSYRPEELFGADGSPAEDILALCPSGDLRIAMNPHTRGGERREPLKLPKREQFAVALDQPGTKRASSMEQFGAYLRETADLNASARNFRVVCPDELESNRLGELLQTTSRQFTWPLPDAAPHVSPDGRVLEMLSEHMCQGWLQGYLLTGRHGLFPCYEAFIPIIDGMMNQYAKFLKQSLETPWRKPISSLNYLLTSESWRQDHNGYSHQGPGFINNLLTKKGYIYRVFLPPDANSLLVTLDECLRSTNSINLVVAGKQPMPQWLSLADAEQHVRDGASIWRWASSNNGEDPQAILVGCGDNLQVEVMAAAWLLRTEAPHWRIRVVNVSDLLVLGIPQKYPRGMDAARFDEIFPLDCPIIFNFHGYTAAIKQLCWERPQSSRFDINGYREEGTTTTPFDMHVRNRTSRYHLILQTARYIAENAPTERALAASLTKKYEQLLTEHRSFIERESVDPPAITTWEWSA